MRRLISFTFENPYEQFGDSVDVKMATQLLETVTSVVNSVLGLLVLFIILGFSLITAVDILYLTNPTAHDAIESKVAGDERRMFGLISKSAVKAYEVGVESGKQILFVYLGLRSKIYIIAAIAVWVMLAGYDTVVTLVAKLISGILENVIA